MNTSIPCARIRFTFARIFAFSASSISPTFAMLSTRTRVLLIYTRTLPLDPPWSCRCPSTCSPPGSSDAPIRASDPRRTISPAENLPPGTSPAANRPVSGGSGCSPGSPSHECAAPRPPPSELPHTHSPALPKWSLSRFTSFDDNVVRAMFSKSS